jgi:WD40 repeat protein
MRRKAIQIGIISVILIIIFSFFYYRSQQNGGNVMITSLSSDGHYAITTDDKDYAILWNLQKHTKKIISRNADAYSAYWIKGTPYYMWQNWKTKVIHVTDVVTGQDVRQMHPNFIVFSQAMSANLKYNVASDKGWNIWVGEGHLLKLLARGYDDSPGFYNKLINFTFFENNKVLTSGFGDYDATDLKNSVGIDLWNLQTRKSIRRFLGNQVETFATISPDGKYVVAGDIATNQLVWNIKTGKQVVTIFVARPLLRITKAGSAITDQNTIPAPKDFYDRLKIFSIKFIDANHYLVFTVQSHYAILYQTLNPKPLKYLDLGNNPVPATYDLERDQSMDTSPSAHILVMAKNEQPGIMVYHYDPKTQTLKKIWDGK